MKKNIIKIIIIVLLIGILSIIFAILNKKNENKNLVKIKLAEVTHSSFYAPLYVANELGYFKDEGIELEIILTPGADKVSAAVLSNSVDIGFAGAESAIYVYEQEEKDFLQIFAGLTKRDGQFIVAREDIKDFKLTDLYGKEILVGRSTGMPALNFLNALKKNNIDTNKININYSIDFASLSGSFIGGTGDFVNLFEPNATALEQNNNGYVVASVGLLSDEVPYTTFYAKKSYIEKNKELLEKFSKALNKGIEYTLKNDSKLVAEKIINVFPDTKVEDLAMMIDRYKEYDCWLENPFISETIFNNMEDFLSGFDLIKNKGNYQNLVNNLYHE